MPFPEGVTGSGIVTTSPGGPAHGSGLMGGGPHWRDPTAQATPAPLSQDAIMPGPCAASGVFAVAPGPAGCRAASSGRRPQREPYMELRDTSKIRERDNL